MPELPDVDLYVMRLRERLIDQPLQSTLVKSPFVVRSVELRPAALVGGTVRGIERLGKRIVFAFDGANEARFLVIHLMVAGRFKFHAPGAAPKPSKMELARFGFSTGTLVLTEASTKKRASIHVVQGREALRDFDRGGIDPLTCSVQQFLAVLRAENHTLKRSLTDPRLFSGIGNAYSDEILFHAKLSPLKLTSRLDDDEIARLHETTQRVLVMWRERLAAESPGFPEKVTAFRSDFAVHGRYGKPCLVCGRPVMRIAYAENEANYCATCQNEGRLLADRALSRLMKDDFPRTLEALEAKKEAARALFAGAPPERAESAPAPVVAAKKKAVAKTAQPKRAKPTTAKARAPKKKSAP